MCSGNACTSSGCCAQLYNLYCRIFELYRDCTPNAAILIGINYNLAYFLENLESHLFGLFAIAKCGKITCCDGIVESIYCMYQAALSALTTTTDPGVASQIYGDMNYSINGVLTAAGYPPP